MTEIEQQAKKALESFEARKNDSQASKIEPENLYATAKPEKKKIELKNPFEEGTFHHGLWELIPGFNAKALLQPIGWRILVYSPPIEENYKGTSIKKAPSAVKAEEYNTSDGYLVAYGDAYNKCKVTGNSYKFTPANLLDRIVFPRLGGRHIEIDGCNFRIFNDDEILGVIPKVADCNTFWKDYVLTPNGAWNLDKPKN